MENYCSSMPFIARKLNQQKKYGKSMVRVTQEFLLNISADFRGCSGTRAPTGIPDHNEKNRQL